MLTAIDANKPPKPLTERAVTTDALISAGASDKARWSNPGSLAAAWNKRASIAAGFIPAGATVLDLGCGAMALGHLSPKTCTYLPADIVARSRDCLVVDLNAGDYPGMQVDATTMLGVLEYIHRPDKVLRRAAEHSGHLIVSYVAYARGAVSYRRGMGWVNDYRPRDVPELLADNGWKIDQTKLLKWRWRTRERLYVCSRA